jgi:hypothetical protein
MLDTIILDLPQLGVPSLGREDKKYDSLLLHISCLSLSIYILPSDQGNSFTAASGTLRNVIPPIVGGSIFIFYYGNITRPRANHEYTPQAAQSSCHCLLLHQGLRPTLSWVAVRMCDHCSARDLAATLQQHEPDTLISHKVLFCQGAS